ncbi:hypothetical protein PQI07_35520 [Methylobacterium sp. 092160098-2]|jgi:hypothetical protein|uniref:hypothetical protein n=1 Tax=Methylobacterium sp. 092160098-2 TaxID=3025129 RepID=UPI0023819996|nr:hypothetical protein [Methylobacterium sp. 092160098-2]MDE4915896.1 hypothetical protein [Methylobacterium sp. 092160098-2]
MFKLPRQAALAAVLPLAGCMPAAVPAGLILPSDPDVPVRTPRYGKVTRGVKDFGVVEPKDWRDLNRQVAPKAGSGGMEGMPAWTVGPAWAASAIQGGGDGPSM